MLITPAQRIIQHSAGPIRWMPNVCHRALVGSTVVIAEQDGLVVVDGSSPTPYLRVEQTHIAFADPVIAALSAKFSSLRSLTDGGVWEGLFTSIVGQAVSLHSASAFQRRLCMMAGSGLVVQEKELFPLPSAHQISAFSIDQVKSAGLTTKRAEGLINVAKEVAAGNLPEDYEIDADVWMRELVRLPMVGPWTAASTLLWGVGHADVYPPGDVALLRAARLAYQDPTMTMKDLNVISERWRPQRSVAARLLWTNLLGMAWDD